MFVFFVICMLIIGFCMGFAFGSDKLNAERQLRLEIQNELENCQELLNPTR